MKLKKVNAAFGLLTILLLISHAGYQMVAFIKFVHDEKITMVLGGAIMACMVIHMVLALTIVMIAGDGTDISAYPRDNVRTIMQRASAIGIMVLILGHINSFKILTSSSAGLIIASIIQILFFGMVFIHIATSFSNAFVTLGILESESKKRIIDRVMMILCAVAFVVVCVITIRTYAMLATMQF